jgi:putative ABC transport system ATP-binding protein
MSGPLIVAEDVCVRYGTGGAGVLALEGVSLAVRPGEIIMILGPSGSGKTTLLQILGVLVRPTSGTVLVNGRRTGGMSVQEMRSLRLEFFGFVFQAHHLMPTLTAWENVALALDLKGIRGQVAERHSRELLDNLGLGSRANGYPAQLSGGQRQRVAIARACALDAPVILADEPTASLDSSAGWHVIQLFRELADRYGRAVVFVTHDSRLTAVADRIVALEDGRIVSEATANAR